MKLIIDLDECLIPIIELARFFARYDYVMCSDESGQSAIELKKRTSRDHPVPRDDPPERASTERTWAAYDDWR